LLGIEQCIERQRHDARTHAAPERHRKIDRVVKQKRKPLLAPQPDIEQRGSELAAARLQVAVSQGAVGVNEGSFAAEPALDRRIDEISDGVVWPPLQQVFQHRRSPPDAARAVSDQSLMRGATGCNARCFKRNAEGFLARTGISEETCQNELNGGCADGHHPSASRIRC